MFENYTNDNLKYLREISGLTPSKLSKVLNVDPSTITKWENKTRGITLEQALKIAEYFNIDIADFTCVDLRNNKHSEMVKINELEFNSEIISYLINDILKKLNDVDKEKKIEILDQLSYTIDKYIKELKYND